MIINRYEMRLEGARARVAQTRRAFMAFIELFITDGAGFPTCDARFVGLPEGWAMARDRAKKAYQEAKAEEALLEEYRECVAGQLSIIAEMEELPEEFRIALPIVGVVE